LSIPAPDYQEAPSVAQARLNFNRSALNATAWLRMRTGASYGGTAAALPSWLGTGGTSPGAGSASLPAAVNNILAAAGVPNYTQQQIPQQGGQQALTGQQQTTPEAAQQQQEMLDAARKQLESMQGSNSIFAKMNRFSHTGADLALMGLDTGLEVVRNTALATMRDAKTFTDHPSVHGFINAIEPDLGQAVADTSVNAFINTWQKHGLDYALGPEGIGTGYTLDPASAAALEKEDLAKQFYSLQNGDPATIGRFLAAMVGADKDSTFYKTFSGVVDAATLAMDPLNLIAPEAKAGKLAEGVAARAAAHGSETTAAKAVLSMPGALKSPTVRAAFDADNQTAKLFQDLAEKNPDLATAVHQARSQTFANHTQDDLVNAMMATDINAAGLSQAHLVDAYKTVQWGADTAAKALAKSTDEVARLGWEQVRLDRSITDLAKRLDEELAAHDAAKAAATKDQIAGLEADKADAAGRVTAHQETQARVDAAYQNLFRNVEARDALEQTFQEALVQHGVVDEADKAASLELFRTGNDLQDHVYRTIGDSPQPDLKDIRTGLRAVFGMTDRGVNMRTAISGLQGGRADAAAEAMVAIDDPAVMRDLMPKVDVRTIRMMAGVKDKDEAMFVLLGQALYGDVGDFANRATMYLANKGERIGSQGSAVRRREAKFNNAVRRNVPSTARVHVEDDTAVVNLADDLISSAAVIAHRSKKGDAAEWWDFRHEWINKVIDAPTWTERKKVMIELNDELIKRSGVHELEKESRDSILAQLGRISNESRLDDERAVTMRANMRDGGEESALFGARHDPTEPARIHDRLIRSGADLSQELTIPDTDVLRKLYRAVDEAKGLQKKGKWTAERATMLNDLFDSELRPLYLTMRPGFMALQIADGSMRSMLHGATNPVSRPLTTAARVSSLVTKERPWLEKITKNLIGTDMVGADGLPLVRDAQSKFWETGMGIGDQSEAGRLLRGTHFRDYQSGQGVRTVPVGMKIVQPGEEGFHKAWAQDALRFFAPGQDPVFDAVLSVRSGEGLPKGISDWAVSRWGDQAAPLDPQDVATDYFLSGPGRSHLADVANASRTDAGLPPYMQTIFRDRDSLHNYLWSEDEAGSVHNLASDLTGKFHPDAVNMLRDVAKGRDQFAGYLSRLTPRKAKQLEGEKATFHKDVRVGDDVVPVDFSSSPESWAGQQLKAMGVQEPRAVQMRATVQVAQKGGKQAFKSWNESFFGLAGRLDRFVGQAPFVMDEMVLQTALRISSLTPQDAAKVRDLFIEKNIPKYHKSPKMKQAERLLKKGAEMADGDGTYTIEDITKAADRAAVNKAGEVMYGLKGRNAEAQRTALLLPFSQAAANGYKVYTRGMAENPMRAVNVMRAWQDAHTEDSGVIYDIMPGVHRDDPTQPLIWTDSYGNEKFSVPFLGYVMHGVDSALGLLPFYTPNPSHTDYMDVNVGKWNPMNFGEPLPGVGMGVTIPAGAVKAAFGDSSLPSWMDQYITPYQASDVDQDQGSLYSNAPWFIKALFPSPQQQMASTGTAMSALMASHPERYADPQTGYITQEGASLLTRDAADLAKSLAGMGQIRSAVLRGGVSQPTTITDIKDGRAVAVSVVYDEYEKEKNATTSGQAFSHILDQYGTAGIAYLIGKRETVAHATDAGYQFARANQDVLDASPDVLGYFFPASDIKYRSPQYDRLLSQLDKGHLKTPEEYAQDINRVIWQARVGQLDSLVSQGKVTSSQYKTAKSLLSDQYGVADKPDINTNPGQVHIQLKAALTNKELASSQVGQSLSQFYQAYDALVPTLDGKTFSGQKDQQQRDTMLAVGQALARANPQFEPLWDSQLKYEFRE
jgi:hypothetical protein